jgi:hypothetical protein
MPVIVMTASLLRHFLKQCSGFGRTIPSSKLLGVVTEAARKPPVREGWSSVQRRFC